MGQHFFCDFCERPQRQTDFQTKIETCCSSETTFRQQKETQMKDVYDLLKKIRATPSKNEKRALLASQADNQDLREFLRVTYEPRINFYQQKIDHKVAVDFVDNDLQFNGELISSIVAVLNNRKVTGNDAKIWLKSVYESLSHDWEKEMLSYLIDRSVDAGFSESAINSIWMNSVTDVPYMRCSLPKDAKLETFPWLEGVFSQVKADGMFANISLYRDGSIRIESRNGSPFPLDEFGDILQEIIKCDMKGLQLHGELLVVVGGKYLPRQESNGLLNKLLKGGQLPPNHTVRYEVWDVIPVDAAVCKGKHTTPYSKRWQQLVDLQLHTMKSVQLIETKIVHSWPEAQAHYRSSLERELEGTIIKHPSMIWKDGTSKEQVKMKLEIVVELKVVGYNEGRNKYEGMLGSLACESADGKLKVNVSGFSDKQRKEIWEERGLNIISVKSNSVMPPENKEHYSLFLPIFVDERLDKNEADTMEKIIEQFENSVK